MNTSNKVCAIMQPTYIPWVGYFDLIDQVDKFVFLDNVQLVKRSWEVRNKIKTAQGVLYLTIPIRKTKSRDETILCEARIDYEHPWKKKHLSSIRLAYRKAPYFSEVYSFIKGPTESNEAILSDFNISIIANISRKIGMNKEFIKASSLKNIEGHKDFLLVSICKEICSDTYISPQGSAVYIEKSSPGGEFSRHGMQVCYQNYEHPVWDQLYGEFIPHVSIIDLLFNYGFDKSLEIIRRGRRTPFDCLHFRKVYRRSKV